MKTYSVEKNKEVQQLNENSLYEYIITMVEENKDIFILKLFATSIEEAERKLWIITKGEYGKYVKTGSFSIMVPQIKSCNQK